MKENQKCYLPSNGVSSEGGCYQPSSYNDPQNNTKEDMLGGALFSAFILIVILGILLYE